MRKHTVGMGLLLCVLSLSACGHSTTSCLAEGTLVATPDGPVPIQDLRVGDVVHGVDPEDGALHAARIVSVRSALRDVLRMQTASGRTLDLTAEHPLYVPGSRRYECAGAWLDGRGTPLAVHAGGLHADPVVLCRPLDGERRVYDVSVASPFRNFLAGGVLVHNKSYPPEPVPEPIENIVSAYDATTMTEARPASFEEPMATLGPALETRLESLGHGVGVVHVSATEPFEGLWIGVHAYGIAAGGFVTGDPLLQLALPEAVTSADLNVTIADGYETPTLSIRSYAGPRVGPRTTVSVP